MKAVIFCDDTTFAAKARSLLRRIGERPGVNVSWTLKTWAVNALRDATLSESALWEAVDAHLIVIPGNHGRSLFPHLRTWLNRWAELREVEEAAIGILDDTALGDLSYEVSPDLRQIVQMHGLNFIYNEDESSDEVANHSMRFPLELEHALPASVAPVSGHSRFEGLRCYGINE